VPACLAGLSDEGLTRLIRLLSTEIDLAQAGTPGPIPLSWLEERAYEAYAERERRTDDRPLAAD
jgi:hypothetical protein